MLFGQIFIVVNNQILKKRSSNLVTVVMEHKLSRLLTPPTYSSSINFCPFSSEVKVWRNIWLEVSCLLKLHVIILTTSTSSVQCRRTNDAGVDIDAVSVLPLLTYCCIVVVVNFKCHFYVASMTLFHTPTWRRLKVTDVIIQTVSYKELS